MSKTTAILKGSGGVAGFSGKRDSAPFHGIVQNILSNNKTHHRNLKSVLTTSQEMQSSPTTRSPERLSMEGSDFLAEFAESKSRHKAAPPKAKYESI